MMAPSLTLRALLALAAATAIEAKANTTASSWVPRTCDHNPTGPLTPPFKAISCRAPVELLNYNSLTTHYPWTHKPECAPSSISGKDRHPYCGFTRDDLHGAQGLIVLTNSDIAADLGHLLDDRNPQWWRAPPQEPLPAVPPYSIVYLDEKGLGVVADRFIPKGTVIMRDSPAILKLAERAKSLDKDEAVIVAERAFVKLPKEEQMRILDLARNMGGQRLDDVVRTNAFRVKFNGVEHYGVFKEVARLNHACRPNAITRWSGARVQMEVLAYTDIQPGEEINISYAPMNILSEDRSDLIMATWGFQCHCALCDSEAETFLSDAHRRQMDRIMEELDIAEVRTPVLVADLAEELEEMIDEEGLDAQRGDIYGILSRVYSEMGDFKGALRYAEKGSRLQEYYKGWDDMRTWQARRFVDILKMRIRRSKK